MNTPALNPASQIRGHFAVAINFAQAQQLNGSLPPVPSENVASMVETPLVMRGSAWNPKILTRQALDSSLLFSHGNIGLAVASIFVVASVHFIPGLISSPIAGKLPSSSEAITKFLIYESVAVAAALLSWLAGNLVIRSGSKQYTALKHGRSHGSYQNSLGEIARNTDGEKLAALSESQSADVRARLEKVLADKRATLTDYGLAAYLLCETTINRDRSKLTQTMGALVAQEHEGLIFASAGIRELLYTALKLDIVAPIPTAFYRRYFEVSEKLSGDHATQLFESASKRVASDPISALSLCALAPLIKNELLVANFKQLESSISASTGLPVLDFTVPLE